jgi:hypothetical protein
VHHQGLRYRALFVQHIEVERGQRTLGDPLERCARGCDSPTGIDVRPSRLRLGLGRLGTRE